MESVCPSIAVQQKHNTGHAVITKRSRNIYYPVAFQRHHKCPA
ncbi:hypothetical protein ABIC83_003870 [Roseateles asaccharophilus]|uniref:Uncharacterized protein n=1 Tax=Roseateles asaccharophilus TaxID=582607 RepID=A0ABU2A853_9BURK|nr:hypothetical protein [Roseateles asaccharophilus]